jgi:predicted ester cyclase
MPILFTTTACVKDWKALREAHRTTLLGRARLAGAKRFQVYRNVNDASQALIVVELPDEDAAREMSRALNEQLSDIQVGEVPDYEAWEPTGWDGLNKEEVVISNKSSQAPTHIHRSIHNPPLSNPLLSLTGETTMSTETNKALVRRIFEEGLNQNKPGVFDELIAPNYVNHNFPAPAPGVEGFKQVIGVFLGGFPDMRITIEADLAEGDRVVTRGYFTGAHTGNFQGIPPTGKQVKINYIDIWRVENGKCVENWVQMDQVGLMQQLGVMPTPA